MAQDNQGTSDAHVKDEHDPRTDQPCPLAPAMESTPNAPGPAAEAKEDAQQAQAAQQVRQAARFPDEMFPRLTTKEEFTEYVARATKVLNEYMDDALIEASRTMDNDAANNPIIKDGLRKIAQKRLAKTDGKPEEKIKVEDGTKDEGSTVLAQQKHEHTA